MKQSPHGSLKKLEKARVREDFRVLYFLLAIVFILHITGCMFHYLAYLEDYNDDTWVGQAELQDTNNMERCMLSAHQKIMKQQSLWPFNMHKQDSVCLKVCDSPLLVNVDNDNCGLR